MIDIETLGTRHDALVIQIGACYFDRETGEIGETFSVNINPIGFADKFSTNYETVKWWMQQSEQARNMVMSPGIGFEEALRSLNRFLLLRTSDHVLLWSHATFDMPILQNAFETIGILHPVPFRNMRDLRTLMDLAGHHSNSPREGTHHHALDDAKFQAKYAVEAMKKLKHGTERF